MTTKDDIQKNINSRLISKPTRLEGGTTQDIVGSVSYELANIIDTKIDVILDNAFVSTADEEHLEIKGEELGIQRKDATYSRLVATIEGAEKNFEISSEILAKTDYGIVFQVLNPKMTDEFGNVEIEMICLTSGAEGNIKEGELNQFNEIYIGLENATITNKKPAYDGYDRESVEEYRTRILDFLKDDGCNSNIADYIAWAKSVSGVKNVVVQDATISGAGKVNVYILSANNDAGEELIKAVKEKIEKEQIINAKLNVFSLNVLLINVSADISLEEGADKDTVKEKFKESLIEYLNKKRAVISNLQVLNMLFETEGVIDVSNFLINQASKSIEPDTLEVPVIGEITLNDMKGV